MGPFPQKRQQLGKPSENPARGAAHSLLICELEGTVPCFPEPPRVPPNELPLDLRAALPRGTWGHG